MNISFEEQGRINVAYQRASRYGAFFIQDLLREIEKSYAIAPEKAYKFLRGQGRVTVDWDEYCRRQRLNERLAK